MSTRFDAVVKRLISELSAIDGVSSELTDATDSSVIIRFRVRELFAGRMSGNEQVQAWINPVIAGIRSEEAAFAAEFNYQWSVIDDDTFIVEVWD